MQSGPATWLFGYAAGVLSTLSPCVLPLAPILVASALAQHRWGPVALVAGLVASFTALGLFVATIGAAIGFDAAAMRSLPGVLLLGVGIVLCSARLQAAFARAVARLGSAGDSFVQHLHVGGWAGQFLVGSLLGLVWSPCVGPTLGAATALAAQNTRLPEVALLMALFGLGAGTPLILVGHLSRAALQRLRGRLLGAGRTGRVVLGVLLVALGAAILTGLDKRAEALLLRESPRWLIELTTRF